MGSSQRGSAMAHIGMLCGVLIFLVGFACCVDPCEPLGRYESDIVCKAPTNETALGICAPFVKYSIDGSLPVAEVVTRVENSIEAFAKKYSEKCTKVRTMLSCAMAFPSCTANNTYVNFPCRDVCKHYFDQCGVKEAESPCTTYPTADCIPLKTLQPVVASSSILVPATLICTLIALIVGL